MASKTQPQDSPNLALYNRVRAVPKEACKNFNNGSFNGTDINPMWRIKILTNEFGMCGIGWYYRTVEHWSEQLNNETAVYVRIELFVRDPQTKEWSQPIEGIGGNKSIQQFSKGAKVSDEGYKMALTDAISVACKALGIGADVYWDKDQTKYTQYYQPTSVPEQPAPAPIAPPAPVPPVPPAQQPQQPGNTKADAIADLKAATSTLDLTSRWGKWKTLYGEDAEVVNVVRTHPFNPNNK